MSYIYKCKNTISSQIKAYFVTDCGSVVLYFGNWLHTPSENVWPSSAALKEGHNSVCRCSLNYLRYAEITREEEREQPSSQVTNSSPYRSDAPPHSMHQEPYSYPFRWMRGTSRRDKRTTFPLVTNWLFSDCLLMPHSKNLHSFFHEMFLSVPQSIHMTF